MVAAGQIPSDSLAFEVSLEPVNTPPYHLGSSIEPSSQVPPYSCSRLAPPASQVPPTTVARQMGVTPRWTAPGPTQAVPRQVGLIRALFEAICYLLNAPIRVPLSAVKGITYIAEAARDQAEEEGDYRAIAKARMVDLAVKHELEDIGDEEYEREVKRIESELKRMEENQ
jgi:hypothetical protein